VKFCETTKGCYQNTEKRFVSGTAFLWYNEDKLTWGCLMNYPDGIKKRLRRVEGQVAGILKMIENEKGCKDVISQLCAARSAIDKTIATIVAANLANAVVEKQASGGNINKAVDDAVDLLIKSKN
jgi:DNA-binding FrmR family transcriptional regulator